MTLAQQTAQFVLNTDFADLPDKVVEKAKQHILDTVGVMVAATADPMMGVLQGFLQDLGSGGGATILGDGQQTSVINAALLNGTLAHGLDFDDNSWTMIGHPSAVVLPTVLALAELRRSSGRDIITAYVIGTEVSCKIGLAAEPDLYQAGWHATGVVGVLGATAASGYLLGLSESQLCMALGIGASLACGLRQNFGSLTKPLHAGAAAQHGVTAALLAKNGFTSGTDSFEGKAGYFHNFTNGSKNPIKLTFGAPFDVISDQGFIVKPYPCCAGTHTGIEATLNLVNKYDLKPADIARIQVGSGPGGPVMLIHHQPKRGFEGKFSMPFVVAMAIRDRKVGVSSFTDDNANDPVVRDLIAKTDVIFVDPEYATRSLDEAPARVTITTKDGRQLTECLEKELGSLIRPMSDEVLQGKFRECMERRLKPEKVDQSLRILTRLEDLSDVKQLINTLIP